MTKPTLRHFSPLEFGAWWPLMSNDLLLKLDEFRERWGGPVSISRASGAIGRDDEPDDTSQHNPIRWGEVRAVDVIPSDMDTPGDRQRAFEIARDVGFTGIGVYPDWSPSPGLHLDVRSDREPGDPAVWAGVQELQDDGETRQVYVAIERGFV